MTLTCGRIEQTVRHVRELREAARAGAGQGRAGTGPRQHEGTRAQTGIVVKLTLLLV